MNHFAAIMSLLLFMPNFHQSIKCPEKKKRIKHNPFDYQKDQFYFYFKGKKYQNLEDVFVRNFNMGFPFGVSASSSSSFGLDEVISITYFISNPSKS